MESIKMIVLDVDGTLTDGGIYIDNHGNEIKRFNAKDGLAIAQSIKHGVDCAIITGRDSQIVEKRSKELGIKHLYQGVHDKKDKLESIAKEINIPLASIAYIGDDINDLEVMKAVGFPACPNDAVQEVRSISKYIATSDGGKGAVREIIEYILKEKGIWEKIVTNYVGASQ
jgi:3-deoxy-D-manno-octulosonate 8-phosphate phosphatase (KDO 8-P phosphatase)